MNQTSNVIYIFDEDKKINKLFVKANRYILKKYEDYFINLNLEQKKEKLKDFWFTEFNVELIEKNNVFDQLKFKSDNDLLVFLVKWG